MDTRILSGELKENITYAAELLRRGEVVAMPTETVYGLAADAGSEAAVVKIFAAKGRPQDNPLIVHIADIRQLADICEDIPPQAYALAERFWPGPLTMVLKKSGSVCGAVTCGLDTVGVRMPAHDVAARLIRACGRPLAAPSANSSGRPSPTTAAHVLEDMAGKIPCIIDGGACSVGVESTVVDMRGETPVILRPGAVTEEMIAAVLGGAATDGAAEHGLQNGEQPRSPGMKYRHYAPRAELTLLEGSPEATAEKMRAICGEYDAALCFDDYAEELAKCCGAVFTLGESFDHREHARRLFAVLRDIDAHGAERVCVQSPRICGRNAATVNRLRRACGFKTVRCGEKQIIGVTGRSGSGKSEFCRELRAWGAEVLDADGIYKELLEDSAELNAAIAARFPSARSTSGIDRVKLAEIVFADSTERTDLNAITHAFVIREMKRRMAAAESGTVVLDVPLLFESGLDRVCTVTVGMICPDELLLRRITERDGIDEARARARLAAQNGTEYYDRRCDILLENSGDIAALKKKIKAFAAKYTM